MSTQLLLNKTVVMTGGTNGIGAAALTQLVGDGAHVYLLCRNLEKGKEKILHSNSANPNSSGRIELIRCDLADLNSVNNACNDILTKCTQIDILINNAGLWAFSLNITKDKIEETLQVNVLAPFLIMHKLGPVLAKSSGAKIINTASGLHQGNVQFDDIEFRKKFSGFKCYRQSKLMVILLTRSFALQFKNEGIGVYSLHPGLVKTGLLQGAGWFAKLFFRIFGISPEKGAKTLLYLTRTNASDLTSGAYYSNQKVTLTRTKASNDMLLAKQVNEICLSYLEKYHLK